MALFTQFGFPGIAIGLTGLHLNLYSAPVYLMILAIFISMFLILLFFDGKMRLLKTAVHPIEHPDEIVEEKKTKSRPCIKQTSNTVTRGYRYHRSLPSSKEPTIWLYRRFCVLLNQISDDYWYGVWTVVVRTVYDGGVWMAKTTLHTNSLDYADNHRRYRCHLEYSLYQVWDLRSHNLRKEYQWVDEKQTVRTSGDHYRYAHETFILLHFLSMAVLRKDDLLRRDCCQWYTWTSRLRDHWTWMQIRMVQVHSSSQSLSVLYCTGFTCWNIGSTYAYRLVIHSGSTH